MKPSKQAARVVDPRRHRRPEHQIDATKSGNRRQPRELRPRQIAADRDAVKSQIHILPEKLVGPVGFEPTTNGL